jgi:hypothetical protein
MKITSHALGIASLLALAPACASAAVAADGEAAPVAADAPAPGNGISPGAIAGDAPSAGERAPASADENGIDRGEVGGAQGLAVDPQAGAASAAAREAVRPELDCRAPASDDTAFGWTRDRLFGFVCRTGRWVDSGFGDQPFDAAEKKIAGYLSLALERREHLGFEVKPRFRVRLPLPNLNRRLNLSIERDDERRTVSGESVEGERPLDAAVVARDDTTTISLGLEARRALDRLLDFRLGIRAQQGKPNPFVRSRLRRDYARGTDAHWRFSQSLFYRHLDGFGETTTLDYENFLSGHWLFRWSNRATLSQVTDGLAWQTDAQLWHALSAERALQFTLGWRGESAAEVPLANYGYRLTYRQTLGRPWLVGELYGGTDFSREARDEPREIRFYAGAKLEIHYGHD